MLAQSKHSALWPIAIFALFNSLVCGPMAHSCFYEVTVPMTQERYQIKDGNAKRGRDSAVTVQLRDT